MNILGKYTLFAEGARGSLSKRLGKIFNLHDGRDYQKFGLGLKELWELKPQNHKKGMVLHTAGWPLDNKTGGGVFMRLLGREFGCSVGFVLHLNYQNPYISPFDEFQRVKWCIRAAGKAVSSKAASASAGGARQGDGRRHPVDPEAGVPGRSALIKVDLAGFAGRAAHQGRATMR